MYKISERAKMALDKRDEYYSSEYTEYNYTVEEDIDWGKDHDLRPGSVKTTYWIKGDVAQAMDHIIHLYEYQAQQDDLAAAKKRNQEAKIERIKNDGNRLYLHIPFKQKDAFKAKHANARWDNDKKSWYLDNPTESQINSTVNAF